MGAQKISLASAWARLTIAPAQMYLIYYIKLNLERGKFQARPFTSKVCFQYVWIWRHNFKYSIDVAKMEKDLLSRAPTDSQNLASICQTFKSLT